MTTIKLSNGKEAINMTHASLNAVLELASPGMAKDRDNDLYVVVTKWHKYNLDESLDYGLTHGNNDNEFYHHDEETDTSLILIVV